MAQVWHLLGSSIGVPNKVYWGGKFPLEDRFTAEHLSVRQLILFHISFCICMCNILCMYVCISRLGMLIFCARRAPAILELDSTVTHSCTIVAVVSSWPHQTA